MQPLTTNMISFLTILLGLLSLLGCVLYCAFKSPHSPKRLILIVTTYVFTVLPLVFLVLNSLLIAGNNVLLENGYIVGASSGPQRNTAASGAGVSSTVLVFSLGYAMVQLTSDALKNIKNRRHLDRRSPDRPLDEHT